MKNMKEIRRFIAKSDTGQEYIVIEYQEYLQARTLKIDTEIPSLKTWITSKGLVVNQIDAKTFQIVETNQIIREV